MPVDHTVHNKTVRRLVDELLGAAATSGMSQRGLARAAGLGESVPGTWRHSRSGPQLGSALNAGMAVGLRLEWENTGTDEPAERSVERPAVSWQPSRRNAPPIVVEPDAGNLDYISQLLGAELHWHRVRSKLALAGDKGVNHGTWWSLERGLGQPGSNDPLVRSYCAAGA